MLASVKRHRWVVGLGAGGFASGYATQLFVLLFAGAGYSANQPGGSKSVASWFGPSLRGLAMGGR